jgi:hypothetical protein
MPELYGIALHLVSTLSAVFSPMRKYGDTILRSEKRSTREEFSVAIFLLSNRGSTQSVRRKSMITLKLDEQEQQVLVEMLEREIPKLRHEIHHTDDRAYKDFLKAREQLLDRLLTTMKTTTTMSPSAPSSS